MPIEIICAIITAVSVTCSSIISLTVSRRIIDKEIKMLKLTWQRDDVVSTEDEFAKMVEAVARYENSIGSETHSDAVGKLSAIRAREIGELATKLDALYEIVNDKNKSDIANALSAVIAEKRKRKGEERH